MVEDLIGAQEWTPVPSTNRISESGIRNPSTNSSTRYPTGTSTSMGACKGTWLPGRGVIASSAAGSGSRPLSGDPNRKATRTTAAAATPRTRKTIRYPRSLTPRSPRGDSTRHRTPGDQSGVQPNRLEACGESVSGPSTTRKPSQAGERRADRTSRSAGWDGDHIGPGRENVREMPPPPGPPPPPPFLGRSALRQAAFPRLLLISICSRGGQAAPDRTAGSW